jgi:hypothetical protein
MVTTYDLPSLRSKELYSVGLWREGFKLYGALMQNYGLRIQLYAEQVHRADAQCFSLNFT